MSSCLWRPPFLERVDAIVRDAVEEDILYIQGDILIMPLLYMTIIFYAETLTEEFESYQRWAELTHWTVTTLIALRDAARTLTPEMTSSQEKRRSKTQQKWMARLNGVSVDSYDAIIECLQEVRICYLSNALQGHSVRSNVTHCRDTRRERDGQPDTTTPSSHLYHWNIDPCMRVERSVYTKVSIEIRQDVHQRWLGILYYIFKNCHESGCS